MAVFALTEGNRPAVARMMSRIKPDWWTNYNDAFGQLSDIEETIGTVGWLLGDSEDKPMGWVLCRELKGYQAIELECCGYDDHGSFALEHKLGTLFDTICMYAREKGYLTFRTAMGSTQFNIHGRPLGPIGEELQNLTDFDRVDYRWLLDYGFQVVGLQPHALGKNYHCILLTKDLTEAGL